MSTDLSNFVPARSLPSPGFYSGKKTFRGVQSRELLNTTVLAWTIQVFSAIALGLSSYLAWVAFSSGKVAGCGSGNAFDCSPVLSSQWSTILGVPVSVPAILLYATVLGLLLLHPSSQRLSIIRWSLISFAAFSAGLGAIWFVGLQFLWLQQLCPYCLGVHACGLAIAGLIAWKAPAGKSTTGRLAALAILPVTLLIAAQISMPAPEKFELLENNAVSAEVAPSTTISPSDTPGMEADSGEIFQSPLTDSVNGDQASAAQQLRIGSGVLLLSPIAMLSCQVINASDERAAIKSHSNNLDDSVKRRTATIFNNVRLDVSQWPLLGKPDAKYVFVEMLDYTCIHCQNTHAAIRGAMDKYGDQLAVIILPVPLNSACNPHHQSTSTKHSEACQIAKVAIAVWLTKPDQFGLFHQWLLESKPTYAQALSHASQIAGEERLRKNLKSDTPSNYIAKSVKLYQRAGAGAVPKLLFPTKSAVGEMRSASTLNTLIESELARAN